jgi:hypothetical protein
MQNDFIYYIQIKDQKKGSFTVDEIRKMRVSPKSLVWRNDLADWIVAESFTEIVDSLVDKPPLLPIEKKQTLGKSFFKQKVIKSLVKYYIISVIILASISTSIAIRSWESYSGKDHLSEFGMYTPLEYTFRYNDPSIGFSGMIGLRNEDNYAANQNFILRPLCGFFSTIYLSENERNSNILLFFNLLLSSSILLFIIFFVIGLIRYYLLVFYIPKENK